ncbi:MAG: TIGR03619 family F420-dependent LLM class oxidoreductase [Actinobacteria bacterium]|nr:TIGR03619 family F420-dependent LLM class oxidoreductase [Actinomycetota bacterium]
MRIGVTVFLTDTGIDPATLARAVEERGFDALYLPEHTHLPVRAAEPPSLVEGVHLEDYRRSLDPIVALAVAATVTDRITLGTGVLLVAQHDPIDLAKSIATLDHLSHGRFVLGFGYGWNRAEAADHGIVFATRRELAGEKLALMEALWSQDEAAFDGEMLHLEPTYAWPKTVQQPRVRTLIGGGAGPKLFGAVAAHADGWMPIGGSGLSDQIAVLGEAWDAAGRGGRPSIVPFGVVPSPGKLAHYEALGCDEVVLRVPMGDEASVIAVLDDHARIVAEA